MTDSIKIETIKFIEKEVRHLQDKMDIQFSKNEKAVRQAQKEMNRRLEGMNEFREQMKDQEKNYLTKQEYSAKHDMVMTQIETLNKIVYTAVGIGLFLQLIAGYMIIHLMAAK